MLLTKSFFCRYAPIFCSWLIPLKYAVNSDFFRDGISFAKIKPSINGENHAPVVNIFRAPRGLGDLRRMTIYFHGAGEHW